jgi:hypothetical protein
MISKSPSPSISADFISPLLIPTNESVVIEKFPKPSFTYNSVSA